MFGKKQMTVPLMHKDSFGGIELAVTPEAMDGGIITYRIRNRTYLIFPLKRSNLLRPLMVEDMLRLIYQSTEHEVTTILSKRGLILEELKQLVSTQESERPSTVIGRLWVLVSVNEGDDTRVLAETIEALLGHWFEHLPIDEVLTELNPLAEIPSINRALNILGLDIQPDHVMFTVEEIAAFMQSTGIPFLLRGSEIYLGRDEKTYERMCLDTNSLSNNMMMVLGTSGKGKSVFAGQIAYRIAEGLIVVDVGGPSRSKIGWNSDPHISTSKILPNQLVDILTAKFPTEDAYLDAAKSFLNMCGITATREMMSCISYLYFLDERGIESVCKLFKTRRDEPNFSKALEHLEAIKKEYEFIQYPMDINVHFDISKAKEAIPLNTYLLFSFIGANMSSDDEEGVDEGLFSHAAILEELPKLLDMLETDIPGFDTDFIKREVYKMLTAFMRDVRKRDVVFLMVVHTYSEILRNPVLHELFQHSDAKFLYDSAPLFDPIFGSTMADYDISKISAKLEQNRSLGGTTKPRTVCAVVADIIKLIEVQLEPNHLATLDPGYTKLIGKQPLLIKGELPAAKARDLGYTVFHPPRGLPISVYTPHLTQEDTLEKILASIVLGYVGTYAPPGWYYLSTNDGDKAVVVNGSVSEEVAFIRRHENVRAFMNDTLEDRNISSFMELLKFLIKEGVDLRDLSTIWDGALEEHIELATKVARRNQ